MERWDFNCQKCERNIGNAWCVDPEWYQCAQDRKKYPLLERAFLQYIQENCSAVVFNDKGIVIAGSLPTNKETQKEIQKCIIAGLRAKGSSTIHSRIFIYIDFEKKIAWWSPKGESQFSEENYQRAGLVEHKVQGRGRGRLGYCFCVEYAEDIGYKCPLCGSELVKVTGDQHPGGHWGIRGVRKKIKGGKNGGKRQDYCGLGRADSGESKRVGGTISSLCRNV